MLLIAIGLVLLVLGLLLWSRSGATEFQAAPRVGIVSMVTSQENFETWLQHHRDLVDRIYLRIENAPELEALAKGEGKIYYESAKVDSDQLKNAYFSQMDRQGEFVSRMLRKAKEDGLEVLFHIDSDELIWVKQGSLADQLMTIPKDTATVQISNHEAVFHTNENCFQAVRFRDCQKTMCTSYANGKSAAILANEPRYYGPHLFLGKSWKMPASRVVILHFDSCTFDQWKRKFQRMAARTDPKKIKEIPFPFYRKSIELIQRGATDVDLLEFYRSQKWG